MGWNNDVTSLSPYVVRVETRWRMGTGFVCRAFGDTLLIATANHVVTEANEAKEPIEILRDDWTLGVEIEEQERTVISSPLAGSDTAIIFVKSEILPDIAHNLVPFIAWDKPLEVGEEVAWLGFPGIDSLGPRPLCLFSGIVSAKVGDKSLLYLIDGSGIQGVSGGPVFRMNKGGHPEPAGKPSFLGVISTYHPHFTKIKRPNKKREQEFSIGGLVAAESLTSFSTIVATYENLTQTVGEVGERLENWKAAGYPTLGKPLSGQDV